MTCRCGAGVEGVALTEPPPRMEIPPPPDTTRRDRAIKIGIAIAGILIAGVMLYRSTRLANGLPPIAFNVSAGSKNGAAPAPARVVATAARPAAPAPATAEAPP